MKDILKKLANNLQDNNVKERLRNSSILREIKETWFNATHNLKPDPFAVKDMMGQLGKAKWGLNGSHISMLVSWGWPPHSDYVKECLSLKYTMEYEGVVGHHVSNLLSNCSAEKEVSVVYLQLFYKFESTWK